MPRQPRLPVQYFADILDELKGVNERLDTLIGQSAPQATPAPAEPAVEPAPVRLEEPVRPTLEPSAEAELRDAAANLGAIDVDTAADEQGEAFTCQEQTKRGNVCGKPLPCRYHG